MRTEVDLSVGRQHICGLLVWDMIQVFATMWANRRIREIFHKFHKLHVALSPEEVSMAGLDSVGIVFAIGSK